MTWFRRDSARGAEPAPATDSPRQPAPAAGCAPGVTCGGPGCRLSIGDDDELLGISGHTHLPAPEAAAQFVVWLQQRGETGAQLRSKLIKLYGQFCLDLHLVWLPDNVFFRELKRAGCRSWETRLPTRDGHRQRVTVYDIPRPAGSNLAAAAVAGAGRRRVA